MPPIGVGASRFASALETGEAKLWIILGLKPSTMEFWQQRQGLMIDGLGGEISSALCEVLRQDGNFELQYVPASFHEGSEHRIAIADFLQQDALSSEGRSAGFVQDIATRLLYLRGRIETPATEDAVLWVGETAKISRAWLRQELRRSRSAQQIVILDCAGATTLEDWVEDLKVASDHGQCILACASPQEEPDLFSQVLLEALIATPAQTGLSMAGLLAKLQTNLDGLGLNCHLWLSGTQGLIEMLPSTIGISTQAEQQARSLQVSPEASVPDLTTAPAFDLAAFLNRIETILLSLVGPIAPTLLAQVESNDPQTLISDLLALLPLHQHSEFERQAQAVLQSSFLAPNPVPPGEFSPVIQGGKAALPVAHPSVTAAEPSVRDYLDGVQNSESIDFDAVERILREIIGPITSTLLAQLPPQARTVPEVIQELSSHLSLSQRQRLEAQMTALTQSAASSHPPQPILPNRLGSANRRGAAMLEQRSTNHELDEVFIQRCEQELIRLIGPIAKFIITTTQETHTPGSRLTFVERLMDEIPDQTQAHEFRKQVLSD